MLNLCPKLSPLQSRLAACLSASLILLLTWLALTKPQFAYAIELDSLASEDHNHYIILDDKAVEDWISSVDGEEAHQVISARAEDGVSALANNDAASSNIQIGETQNWVFPKDVIDGPAGEKGIGFPGEEDEIPLQPEAKELRRRQSTKRVYIALNTCLQPASNGTTSNPPQLQMRVSLSGSNQKPGPGSGTSIKVDGGYALYEVESDTDVYVGISAPNTTDFSGIWNYNLAASIDAPYYSFIDPEATGQNRSLYFVDSDNHAALLVSNDTTQDPPNSSVYQKWMQISPPWGVFASVDGYQPVLGLERSFCGLKNHAQLIVNIKDIPNQNVAQMTNRGLGGLPKEQFYITGLNSSTNYRGMRVQEGNSTASGSGVVGGGGKVWASMHFATKSSNNCALMYNLSFCSEVAYAVPSNPNKFPPATGLQQLGEMYDNNTKQMYQYFNYSLQQIPCNTTSSAQYSLARNCDDCARAYKQWLCAVTIPRCEDFDNPSAYLKPRNLGQPFINGSSISANPSSFDIDQALLIAVATNSSRNPLIDNLIQPGPYREVLPCQDLCYDLMQSCPAALGFSCPLEGKGLEDSYGKRVNASEGVISCSYLGAAYYLSGSSRIAPGFELSGTVLLALLVALMNMG